MPRRPTVPVLPASLAQVLAPVRSCFTAPSYRTFTALVTGMLAQTGPRTVCGMLTGANLARAWHHCRAYRWFTHARWNPRQVGLLLARMVVSTLLDPDEPVTLAVDDTLFRRRGKTIHAVGWFHDGTARGRAPRLAWGNNWVVVAILVRLPFGSRPVALPVLAALVGADRRSRPQMARELIDQVAAQFPTRTVHVVGDAGYGCRALALGAPGQPGQPGRAQQVTMTTRAKTNIALYDLPPPRRPGQRGRNRLKGTKIGTPPQIAAQASTQRRWRTTTVRAYGTSSPVRVTDRLCLWYGAWHVRRTRLVLVRNHPHRRYRASDYNLALVTTDTDSTVEQLIARYAARWGIEVAFHDAKHLLGVGQTRTRTPAAVARCVPFGLCCHTLLVLWYVRYGHDPADVVTRRERQPWYRSKTEPALLDMLTKLRRVIIAARFMPSSPRPATSEEILEVHQAWADAAA